MRKPSTKQTRRTTRDQQIAKFETRDLGADIRTSGVTSVVIRPKRQPTSITLEPDLVEQLRIK